MKTNKEWLETLPEPYKTQALKNMDPKVADATQPSAAEAVNGSFEWSRSSQGKEYWDQFYASLLRRSVYYWQKRCLLAEAIIESSPCDPDITSDQIAAWEVYNQFIKLHGNDFTPYISP